MVISNVDPDTTVHIPHVSMGCKADFGLRESTIKIDDSAFENLTFRLVKLTLEESVKQAFNYVTKKAWTGILSDKRKEEIKLLASEVLKEN